MPPKTPPVYYDYVVKPGDTLSGIIHKMYGQAPSGSGYRKSLDFLLSLNPQIKNPNRIYPGNVIHLGVIPEVSKPITPVIQTPGSSVVTKVPSQDMDYFWALSWLEHNPNSLVIPGSIATGATSNLLSPGNTNLIKKVGDLYAEYKSGVLSKGQYDYQRRIILEQLKKNVGPMEKLLFGNKTARESIRIARSGGVPATLHIEKNFAQLSWVASYGKYGGIVLTGVGLTASCMQIADTQDKHEKNEIFVETVTSTMVGGVGGYLVGLFLISNPVGWGTALVLAAGVTALSYGAGKTFRTAYDKFGNHVDFVSGMGVDRVCR